MEQGKKRENPLVLDFTRLVWCDNIFCKFQDAEHNICDYDGAIKFRMGVGCASKDEVEHEPGDTERMTRRPK